MVASIDLGKDPQELQARELLGDDQVQEAVVAPRSRSDEHAASESGDVAGGREHGRALELPVVESHSQHRCLKAQQRAHHAVDVGHRTSEERWGAMRDARRLAIEADTTIARE